MDLKSLTSTICEAIAQNSLFSADAPKAVFEDFGNMKDKKGAALNRDAGQEDAGPGYNITIWPPARGSVGDNSMAGIAAGDSVIVVRFEVNPKVLPADSKLAGKWFTERLQAIIDSVLAIDPELNGSRFQLAADAFELINFDEGLVAYHVRFVRQVILG